MMHVFMGKGGVGKSTIACAFSLALARKGKVGLLSLDPMSNLGDILEEEVGRGIMLGDLYVREVDVDAAVAAYLKKVNGEVKRSYRYLSAFNLDKRMDAIKLTPGIEEHVLLEEMTSFLREGFETIVVDMPPAGMALRILALPYTEESWLSSLIELRTDIVRKRAAISKISGLTAEEDEILKRLFIMRARELEFLDTLRRSRYYVVKTPDVLAERESGRIKDSLWRMGLENVQDVLNMCDNDGDFAVQRLSFEPRGIENLSLLGVERWLQS
jgi:arsenite-transporting ATPase